MTGSASNPESISTNCPEKRMASFLKISIMDPGLALARVPE
jgi:hypothetical protein